MLVQKTMINSVCNPQPKLTLQPRKSKRDYIYDYHAYIIEGVDKNPFGKGGGISISEDIAKNKAVCEALERYCGSRINKIITKSTFNKIKSSAINPREIIYFRNDQYSIKFPYKKFNKNKIISWVEGYSLLQNKKIFVPASAVYLGYNRQNHNREKFLPTTSNGLALQTSLKRAIVRAIFELIERDAAMTVWFTKMSPPRLDLENIKNPDLIKLTNKIKEEGLIPEVCITTLDSPIPSTIGIVYNKDDNAVPFASFGLATEADLEEAALKSLEEAMMVRNTLEILNEGGALKKINKLSVRDFLRHGIFYAFSSRQKIWKFLLNGPRHSVSFLNNKFGFKEEYLNYQKIIDFFLKQKKEIIYIDVTDNIVKKMGFIVVKVIIPDLHPIDMNFCARFLGGNRLKLFLNKEQNVNYYPHPFA